MAILRHRTRATNLSWPRINLVEIGLILILIIALYQSASFSTRILAYPYPVDYGEGPLLGQVGRLARFENIYTTSLAQPPYTIANYPPVYMLLQVPLSWLFGPAFWYGRLLSLLGMMAAAMFLGLTVQALTRDRWAALLSGLLVFSIPYVKAWAPLFRIDPLALGLSWGGLYLLVRRQLTNRKLLAVALLLTAAIYTRQSYGLAAPLAAFVWLLGQKQPRQAFILGIYVAGLGLGLFGLLNLLTRGGFFFNIVTANLNVFQRSILMNYVGRLMGDLPLLVLLGGLFLLLGWYRNKAWMLAGPYLLGALVSAATIGKIGSNVNYLLEFSAGLCLAAGLTIAGLRSRRYGADGLPSKIGWGLASVCLIALLAGQVYWILQIDNGYDRYLTQKSGLGLQSQVLLDLIEQSPGPVLTGEHMGLLALTGRLIYYQPFEMKQLSDSGVWDQAPFLDELARGDYPLILLYPPAQERRWTPEMLVTIREHYRYVNNFDQTVVYAWNQ